MNRDRVEAIWDRAAKRFGPKETMRPDEYFRSLADLVKRVTIATLSDEPPRELTHWRCSNCGIFNEKDDEFCRGCE